MTLSRTTVAYLEAMGMTAWQRRRGSDPAVGEQRAPPPATRPAPDCLQAPAEPLASVFAQWPGPLALEPGHPGGGLLIKILAALEQPLERFAVYRLREADGALPPADAPGRALFVFAEATVAQAAGAAEVVRLPTLEQMLADSRAKRVAWDRLRPWIAKLA